MPSHPLVRIALASLVLTILASTAEAKGFGRSSKKSDDQEEPSSTPTKRPATGGSFGRSGTSDTGRAREHDGRRGEARRDEGQARHREATRPYDRGPRVIVGDPYWRLNGGYYGGAWGVYPWGYYAYGYHPYWGAPEVPPETRTAAPSTAVAAFFVGAYGGGRGPELTGELSVDGREWGFNARGLTLGNPDPLTPRLDVMPLFGAHATWSFVSGPSARVRAELGFTGIVAPDLQYWGPDLGLSAQLAVAGPFALEGAVHWTPWPASIMDVEAGAALHLGGVALRAGVRALRLDDRAVNTEGDTLSFAGPQLSLGLVY